MHGLLNHCGSGVDCWIGLASQALDDERIAERAVRPVRNSHLGEQEALTEDARF